MISPSDRYLGLSSLKKRVDTCVRVVASFTKEAERPSAVFFGRNEFVTGFESVFSGLTAESRRCGARHFIEAHSYYLKGDLSSGLDLQALKFLEGIVNGLDGEGLLLERPIISQEDDFGTYRPLPDLFVSEAGRRWVFYIESVYPNLVRLFGCKADIEREARIRRKVWRGQKGKLSRNSVSIRRSQLWGERLGKEVLVDGAGNVLSDIPFKSPISLALSGYADLLGILAVCQSSLLQLLLLLTGGRSGEIETLGRTCLVDGDGETLHGRTYKLSGLRVGAKKDWPIPARIAKAVQNQIAIAEYVSPGRNGLWVTVGTVRRFEGPISSFYQLNRFADEHGLSTILDDSNPHPHRFRKTIARLAVACLVGSPAILRQVFGHSDIEVTISYILSDPAIRELLADSAVQAHVSLADTIGFGLDECGGKGGEKLRLLRDEFLQTIFVPANERQQRRTLEEFVEAKLGSADVDLKIIYPGVVCIRQPTQNGLCGNDRNINPSNCRVTCSHHLALPSSRGDTEARIRWLIGEISKDKVQNNELLLPWYRAQLRDQLGIFADIRERWSVFPAVRTALGLADHE